MSRLPAAVSVVLVFVAALPALAAEGPRFQVTIEAVKTVDTVTAADGAGVPGFKPHIRFPGLDKRADGSFRIWYNIGQTHGVPLPGRNSNALSFDHGESWSVVPSKLVVPFTLIRDVGQNSFGFEVNHTNPAGFTSWQGTRYLSTDGGINWTPSAASFSAAGAPYVTIFDSTHDDVTVEGNTWWITGAGQPLGSPTFELILFASTNSGANWERRATIAAHHSDPAIAMGEEGPNEADIVQLDNGNLLAVFRTGQPHPNCDLDAVHPSIFWSMSSDRGFTWSTPKMLGVAGSFPMLRKLPDGSIAMTYGRYGGKLMFADQTGTRWSTPHVIYDGPGSNYVHMRRADTGKYIYIYDQSSFYNPNQNDTVPDCFVYTENGEEIAHMKAAILDIQRLPDADEYDWLFEYHGDVRPDALALPWSAEQTGDAATFLWADQGQDYLRLRTGPRWAGEYHGDVLPESSPRRAWGRYPARWRKSQSPDTTAQLCSGDGTDYLCMSTGPNGPLQSLYYTLGAGTPWTDMDFGDGVVVHLRARVTSASTTQSAASIFAGDGVHGYIALELTGTGVNLEGQGGNGGQVTFSDLNTLEWHTYTLVIAPTPPPSGPIRARLYLDGDYDAPVLTQALFASNVDEIRFGDMTGANNGAWDLDYLQFGSLAETQELMSPPDRTLSFALPAADRCAWWADVDFAAGVVVELRARVIDPATGEGAASVRLSDGMNGHLVLELTPDEVILEGEGGNDGQVAYGGLTMSDWHTYRLVIAPDDSAGGQIRGRLFVDGQTGSPVLAKELGANAVPAELRFGDLAGAAPAANGIWDIEFLRFAPLAAGSLPPLVRSDFDCDRDVDMADFAVLQRCLSGEGVFQGDPACQGPRLDGDSDVDGADLNLFLNCLNGANQPPAPGCLP